MTGVMCQGSGVTCHVSGGVRCPMSHIFFFFLMILFDHSAELVGGGTGNNEAYPVYFVFIKLKKG